MKVKNLINRLFASNQNIYFYLAITGLFFLSVWLVNKPQLAMWLGFAMAGYSVIANDSIQTLGTFIAANERQPWLKLWLFTATIMASTLIYGFYVYHSDLSFGRLKDIPQPLEFNLIELIAPLLLIVMTWFKMPVSTTFLLLSVFSSGETIQAMLTKTACGYGLAILLSFSLYAALIRFIPVLFKHKPYQRKLWRQLQYISTAWLWINWLMHDIANVTVFLPRALSITDAAIVIGYLVLMLALIIYHKGGRIQRVVREKSGVKDFRAATIIDLLYAALLLVLKEWSYIPISTTWVFLGVLAGREIAMSYFNASNTSTDKAYRMIAKDFVLAGSGLMLSLIFSMLSEHG